MFKLTVTDAAAKFIVAEVERSGIRNPAVYLGEASTWIKASSETGRMMKAGVKGRTLEDAIRRDVASASPLTRMILVPMIYPKIHFLYLFLVKISGISFFVPPRMRNKVAGGILDFCQGALVLKDSKGNVIMPKQ
jgi:hypothetical protein